MRLRLPLPAGVHTRAVLGAVALTALLSSCTPSSFHDSPPHALEPTGIASAPTSAQDTISQGAAVLSHQINENRPHERATTEHSNPLPEQVDQLAEALGQTHRAAQEHEAELQRIEEEEAREAEERAQAEQEEERTDNDDDAENTDDEVTTPPTTDEETQPPSSFSDSDVEFNGNLNSYLSDLADYYPGRISISVAELGGEGRSGSSNGSRTYVTASTYKLYLAYTLLKEIDDGEIGWEDAVTGGRSVSECFDDMLMLSDNACPEALGPKLGWPEIYADASSAGAQNTGQGMGAIQTTANDLTRFLSSLASGNLDLSTESQERLERGLSGNIHRQGVPAGTSGTVMNKPGFIDGNLHDAAIVHHADGSYVITVMTNGSNWEAIAAITSDVEAALYR